MVTIQADVFDAIEHEVERFMLGEVLQTLLAKFLFGCAFFGTDEGPGQDEGVFDQVGDIEYKCASAGFTVHDGKAMRDS